MPERNDRATKKVVAEAEARIDKRLAEVEEAAADGRLYEAVKDTPSVAEQLREIAELRPPSS